MGLDEIVDITETKVPGPQGNLVRTFEVIFTTERTSGAKTIQIPADEFSPDVARQRAAERAQAIDEALTPDGEE